MRTVLSFLVVLGICVLLVLAVAEMPAFGDASAPAHQGVMDKYLSDGVTDTGAPNIIAAIILDYRAYDTLGEATVLFVAVLAVASTLVRRE